MLLAAVAMASAGCWSLVLSARLARFGDGRQFVLPPVALALAAFIPTAVAVTTVSREGYDEGTSSLLSWALISLYLVAVAVVLPLRPRTRVSAASLVLFSAVLLYWVVGAVANFAGDLPVGRLSFFLMPIVIFVAWKLRPPAHYVYDILALTTVSACFFSVVLAFGAPEIAFFDAPTRSATFLFDNRLAGIFEHPNGLGLFAAVGIITTWYRGGSARVVGLLVCGLPLIASDSRTAWLGAAVGLSILAAGIRMPSGPRLTGRPHLRTSLGRADLRLLMGLVLIAVVVVVMATYVVPDAQAEGFTGRTAVWQYVSDNWSTEPLLGHGPAVWRLLIDTGQVPAFVGQAHGQFFETLFTRGVIGIFLLSVLLASWTAVNVRSARHGHWLPLALQALLISYAAFESPLSLSGVGPSLWLISLLLFIDPVSESTPPSDVPSGSPTRTAAGRPFSGAQ